MKEGYLSVTSFNTGSVIHEQIACNREEQTQQVS